MHVNDCENAANPTPIYVLIDIRREPCRHGGVFWCEDCVNEAYILHTVLGREDGLKLAISVIDEEAADFFKARQDDKAKLLRDLGDRLRAHLDEVSREGKKIRREQRPEFFKDKG